QTAHVSIVSGDAFGNPECIRISYAASSEDISEALNKMSGGTDLSVARAVLQDKVTFNPSLTWFAPGSLVATDTGERRVLVRRTNTSGDFTALANTDGFVELPANQDVFDVGYGARWFAW
ncbi:MAG: hypothetical protein AB8G17_03100, partial [Gammaproteobacteria bacterium]